MAKRTKDLLVRGDKVFIRSIELVRAKAADFEVYPFSIPAVRQLAMERLLFDAPVTFFVGENGSGKSTLVEAIAVASGFNAEGGSRNFQFSNRSSESELHSCIRLARSASRPRTGYFLRAESFFNVATEIERLDREPGGPPVIQSYGGTSLHEQSHGESFFALLKHRFGPGGLYILDEPEAALSPSRQLAVLCRMDDLVRQGSQFIVATHSPILMAYPGSTIYVLSASGIQRSRYEETEQFSLTRDFLLHHEDYVRRLLGRE
jgi:predicted ATPase